MNIKKLLFLSIFLTSVCAVADIPYNTPISCPASIICQGPTCTIPPGEDIYNIWAPQGPVPNKYGYSGVVPAYQALFAEGNDTVLNQSICGYASDYNHAQYSEYIYFTYASNIESLVPYSPGPIPDWVPIPNYGSYCGIVDNTSCQFIYKGFIKKH